MQVIQCDACAGSVVYDADREVARCLFCGSVAVHPDELSEAIPNPDAQLPFVIDRDRAQAAFRAWARSSWWYPRELRALAIELSDVRLPAWQFDTRVETHWAGLVRALTKSGVRPVSGVARRSTTMMVPASLGLTERELLALEPFEVGQADPWSADAEQTPYEVPSITRTAAEVQANQLISEQHRKQIAHDERAVRCHGSSLVDVQDTRLMMLSIWIGAFRYRDLPWRFVINAQTGKVTGKAPLDRVKVGLAIALTVAIAAAVAWWRLR